MKSEDKVALFTVLPAATGNCQQAHAPAGQRCQQAAAAGRQELHTPAADTAGSSAPPSCRNAPLSNSSAALRCEEAGELKAATGMGAGSQGSERRPVENADSAWGSDRQHEQLASCGSAVEAAVEDAQQQRDARQHPSRDQVGAIWPACYARRQACTGCECAASIRVWTSRRAPACPVWPAWLP